MIICVGEKLKVGDIVEGEYHLTKQKIIDRVTIYVLREATIEEWLTYRKQQNLPTTYNPNIKCWCYKVSTD